MFLLDFQKRKLKIIKEYSDEAISGTTDNRPGFQQMLSEVAKLKPSTLIVWKFDRLGRDRTNIASAKDTLRRAGCRVKYVAETVANEDTPESQFTEAMLESMAEFYSAQLRVNVMRGMRYNAEHALYNGHKTLGYAVDGEKHYVIDEETAPVVRRIFEQYASGVPMQQIMNELNDAVRAMGGEVVGINTETFDGNESAIKEAASVLESQGAKYRNLSIDSSSDAGKYASNIMAFPTTILVDRNGNIVGDPMLGGIDNQDNYDTLMKQIQSVIDADSSNK